MREKAQANVAMGRIIISVTDSEQIKDSFGRICNSISKNVIHGTVFKACTFYFFTK